MRYGRERKLPEGVLVEFFRCPAGAGRAEREPGNGQLACRLMENGRRLGQRRPANIRLSPGVPRRLRPNLKPFVILNEVDRRTQREQRPLADYAEQGGERQTQCSQESFPLRTKGRGRTMPRKEEKDKRSAVKNLSTYTFIQILRRSSDLLRMTVGVLALPPSLRKSIRSAQNDN